MQSGQVGPVTRGTKYEGVFEELACIDGVFFREERVVIPEALVPDILELAHEGHPSEQSMLQQLRQALWWPGMSRDVKEFVQTCNTGRAIRTSGPSHEGD